MNHAASFVNNLPAYLDRLPCVKPAWSDFTSVIDVAKKTILDHRTPNHFVELEMRFGKRNAQGFQAGLTAVAFQNLEARFDSGRDWAKVLDWHNSTAYYHTNVQGNKLIRTETTYSPGCEESRRIECTYKDLIVNHDYRTISLSADGTTGVDLRVAVNVENAVPEGDIPLDIIPSSVHLKVRKCYFYAPTGCDTPVWCYMLTKRWIGETLPEASKRKLEQPPTYEIEMECLSPEYLASKDSAQVATKMLSKACDVLEIIDYNLHDHNSFIFEPAGSNMLWTRKK
jgi:hypothetical protein